MAGIQSRSRCLNPDQKGYHRCMAAPALDWSSAQVHDAVLKVTVSGERPKGWRKSAERTVRLLGSGEWGDVSIRKGTIRVTAVGAGQEERLRFFLAGVVEQANAAHQLTDGAEGDEAQDTAEQPLGADAEMTERFRSFAGE
jgi:hypothetical protein